MASTTDMAPNRTATKAPARRAANGPRRAAARQSQSREDELSAQVHQLQSDLKSIAATLASLAEDKVNDAQKLARREVKNLARTGQSAVEDVQDEFGQLEKQIKDTIREKPLTAVAGAIALGFVLAVVSR
ncbi:MAG: DUF883 family protein [Devosia sp.]|jgi:ElaB/YqjD/DUF883 family membrane-anchored ribosome-binding protein|nr:DUF883 family protein [Devosia sp.]